MAKIITKGGREYNCGFGPKETIIKDWEKAKKDGKICVECGKYCIAIDTIEGVSDRETEPEPPDDGPKFPWPTPIVTIYVGAKAQESPVEIHHS